MAVENKMEDSTRPSTSLNNQAFETVRAVNQQVVGDQAAVLVSIASQAMVQSCSLALQDAVDHLRRVQILAEAANARGIADLAAGKSDGAAVIDAANGSVTAAAASLSEIGESVIALIERLERRGPSEGKD